MKFEVSHTIHRPIEQVFAAHRDDLEDLSSYLPNVESIVVESREELPDGNVFFVNRWKGAASEVPALIRPFVSADKLVWIDRAEWDATKKECTWDIELNVFKDAVHCKGKNTFTANGDRTTVCLSGDVSVDAKKIGIPGFLAGKVGPAIESFVIKLISPNLQRTNEAVEQMLRDRETKKKS